MLPPLHQERYEKLKQEFERFFQSVAQSTSDGSKSDGSNLKATVTQLQVFFQQQIFSLNLEDFTATDEQRFHSLQVEIDKQLRLLGMDAMFLEAAKQVATVKQRQGQITDRLQTLIRYCEAILQI